MEKHIPGGRPYSYTFNNPLKYIDPTGLDPEEPGDGAENGIVLKEITVTAQRMPEKKINTEPLRQLSVDRRINSIIGPSRSVSNSSGGDGSNQQAGQGPAVHHNDPFDVRGIPAREPYEGFWGGVEYFLFGGIENGVKYDREGKPILKGIVTGTPPSFIGGPLGKGQQAIKIGKFLFNPNYFHRIIKPDILKRAGDFAKVVGKNPDIGLDGTKIILKGASNGPFKGKTFETGLSILDFIF